MIKFYKYTIHFFFLFCSFFLTTGQETADAVVNKAIENAGGQLYEETVIQFTFRNKQYKSSRSKGIYQLERFVLDSTGITQDIVNNSGLVRTLDNCPIVVPDSLVTRISDGVNSVHYFASLPYGLNAPAVNKELVGESTIKNEPYFKIKVTFNQEGGGTDFEDVFMYWIHKEKYTVDYLAYKYAVNGGGVRFRAAYHPRTVNGIRFVDYKNYKSENLSIPLEDLDRLYEQDKLPLLSEIKLEDIYVYVNPGCC